MIPCEDILNLTIVSVYPWDSLSPPFRAPWWVGSTDSETLTHKTWIPQRIKNYKRLENGH